MIKERERFKTLAEPVLITPNKLIGALTKAQDLCNLAYAQQPIKQKDGSILMLCWVGRIDRAYDLLANEAEERRAKLLEQLRDVQIRAWNEAELSVMAYHDLCAQVGQMPKSPYPTSCECYQCTLNDKRRNENIAKRLMGV